MTLQRDRSGPGGPGPLGPGAGYRTARGVGRLLGPWIAMAAIALGVILVLLLYLVLSLSGSGGDQQQQNCSTALDAAGGGGAGAGGAGAAARGAPGGSTAGLSPTQLDTASKIIAVAKGLGVGTLGQTIALATARQESNLGTAGMFSAVDHDSLGAFQQRAAWAPGGAAAPRIDVAQATKMFFTGGAGNQPGLLDIAGWDHMTVAQAAQAVQRSAFPGAYARWEPLANALIAQLGNTAPIAPGAGTPVVGNGPTAAAAATAAPTPCAPALAGQQDPAAPGTPSPPLPPGMARTAIDTALTELGKPYVWGATGPNSFDCSGLMLTAFRAAGVNLPRVSREQYSAGVHVPVAQAQPGDLLFLATDTSDPDSIHHVMLYMGNNQIVEAQQTGVPVHVRPINLQTQKELVPLATRPGMRAA